MKLLLIEDNPVDVRLMHELLKESMRGSFQYEHAARLDSALELLQEQTFDLVLLDLGLPDSQGMSTLKATQKATDLPLVVLTGLDDERFALEAVRAGAQDYLIKGHFDTELLVRTIRYAVERKRGQEEVRRLNAQLEKRVVERTAQLQKAIDGLRKEIAERQRAEQAMRQSEHALQEAQTKLEQHAVELEKTVAARTAKLQETVTELEHFSYAITHDMRAPLRAMQGFAALLEEECAKCNRAVSREYLRRIRMASIRMDRLITDSLAYSQTACQELKLEPVDLSKLINSLIETYPNLQADLAAIAVEPNLPVVLGNQGALTQCFSNLLDNAVKFAKAGSIPQIRVRTVTRKDTDGSRPSVGKNLVRICVEDQGIGMPREFLPRVFGMFERAAKDHEGTGMGLAIVRKVARQMGGEAGVESQEGHGSRFWVDLVRIPVDAA